jgi:tetratricopeptide (TPR) repeat protein
MKRLVVDALLFFALPLFLVRNAQLFLAEQSFQQAERLSQEEKEPEALARYARAADIVPECAQYQRALGRSGLRLYQARPRNLVPLYAARQAYKRVLQLDRVYPYDRFEMGEVLEAMGASGVPDLPDPEPYLQQAVATDPTNPLFLAGLLTWQVRHGQKDQARRLLVRAAISGPPAIRLFGPDLLPTHEERVKFAAELGRHPAANLEYANYLIGVKEPELAGPQAALAAALIRQQPESAPGLAQILIALDEPEQAEAVLEKAFTVAPQYLFLAQAWAQLRLRQKDLPGAIAVYQRALRANPKAPELNLALAQLYRQTGQDQLALRHYDRVLEANRANARQRKDIYVAQGEIKRKQGDLRGALVEYKKALELSPQDASLDEKVRHLQVQLEYQGLNGQNPPAGNKGILPSPR